MLLLLSQDVHYRQLPPPPLSQLFHLLFVVLSRLLLLVCYDSLTTSFCTESLGVEMSTLISHPSIHSQFFFLSFWPPYHLHIHGFLSFVSIAISLLYLTLVRAMVFCPMSCIYFVLGEEDLYLARVWKSVSYLGTVDDLAQYGSGPDINDTQGQRQWPRFSPARGSTNDRRKKFFFLYICAIERVST